MKTRLLIATFLCVALLFGASFYFLKRISAQLEPGAMRSASAKKRPEDFSKNKSLVPRQIVVNHTNVIYVTNQFNWRNVESSDYRQYIANLRAIGCPDRTIKDIILTDIMKLYAAQRGQFYHNGRDFKFWETDEKRKLNSRQLAESETRLSAIDKEIPAVLRELLGVNYERELNKYFVDTNEDERRLTFLSEDKRDQVLALREEYEAAREHIIGSANGNLSAADRASLQKIETQRNEELAGLLTESERDQLELTTSPVADQLRDTLIGFNPSEKEFRQLFEMERALDEKYPVGVAGQNDGQARANAEAELQNTLRQQWGEQRYQDYQRSQNPDFRNATIFAEANELPVSTAQVLFETKQVAEEARRSLLNTPNISVEQRAEGLQAIQKETEKAVRAMLGPKSFPLYQQSTGKWIGGLAE